MENPNTPPVLPTVEEQIKEQLAQPIPRPASMGEEVDQSEIPEAFLTDPSLILNDLDGLFTKHGLEMAQVLTDLGFDVQSLEMFLVTKTIPEVIFLLNRRLGLQIWRMSKKNKVATQDVRASLGNCPPSKGWLTMMDEVYIPYIKGYYVDGQLDEDFFMKNQDGLYIFNDAGQRIEPQAERPTGAEAVLEETDEKIGVEVEPLPPIEVEVEAGADDDECGIEIPDVVKDDNDDIGVTVEDQA